MKKFIIFIGYAVGLGGLFLYFLHRGSFDELKLFRGYIYYILAFIALMFIVLVFGVYHEYKKLKDQSPHQRQQAVQQLMRNRKTIKETKMILLLLGLYLIFCGGILFFIDFNEQNFVLLITGLSLTYMGVTILLFWAYRRNTQWKLKQALQAQESLNLQMRSIRSQLNPHFMFNALTSIQNLMNKNDIAAANHYLALFAGLTRKVLNTSEQELISLADELQMLEEYLQMEQLRFGFTYQVKVAEEVNTANTDIPVMLLQPFVENAVKHGVAALQQKGIIDIAVNKIGNDLELTVTDNGPGFDISAVQTNHGYGLKLSEERVALLNLIHKDQPVVLAIDPQPGRTVITIKLVNLLA